MMMRTILCLSAVLTLTLVGPSVQAQHGEHYVKCAKVCGLSGSVRYLFQALFDAA